MRRVLALAVVCSGSLAYGQGLPTRPIEHREPIRPISSLGTSPSTNPNPNTNPPPPGLRPGYPGLTIKHVNESPAPAADTAGEQLTKFRPDETVVRLRDNRWQLWSGPTMLKDFGAKRDDAYEARRLVADMNLTERGYVGAPQPVMEYWLSEGKAPAPTNGSRNVVQFDLGQLRTEQFEGGWVVRDDRLILFNFGPAKADAERALGLVKRHGFNELAVVGIPDPSMVVLVADQQHHLGASDSKTGFVAPKNAPQLSSRLAIQLPGLGFVGERVPFDPTRAEIRKSGQNWILSVNRQDLAQLGPSEYEARAVLRLVQDYPLTEQCRFGSGGFQCYLSRGRPPHGAPLGVRMEAIRPESLTVEGTDTRWEVRDGTRTLAVVPSKDDAELAVKVIHYYRFDRLCEVGHNPNGFRYLARDGY